MAPIYYGIRPRYDKMARNIRMELRAKFFRYEYYETTVEQSGEMSTPAKNCPSAEQRNDDFCACFTQQLLLSMVRRCKVIIDIKEHYILY